MRLRLQISEIYRIEHQDADEEDETDSNSELEGAESRVQRRPSFANQRRNAANVGFLIKFSIKFRPIGRTVLVYVSYLVM